MQFLELIDEIKSCRECEAHLPLGPRPVFQLHPSAKILIAGQAPGRRVHESGIPFDDASGDRLRQWLGIDRETFYDPEKIALLGMGFCFPGTGKSGDLPPRPECAIKWRKKVLAELPAIELTLLIGAYAMDWHIGIKQFGGMTNIVKNWTAYWPNVIPLPHPSPRNNIWLKKNPWFKAELLPQLKSQTATILGK